MVKFCLGWHTDCPYCLQDIRCAWFTAPNTNHTKPPKCGNPAKTTADFQVDIIISGIRKELINQKKIKAQNEEILNLLREKNIKGER